MDKLIFGGIIALGVVGFVWLAMIAVYETAEMQFRANYLDNCVREWGTTYAACEFVYDKTVAKQK